VKNICDSGQNQSIDDNYDSLTADFQKIDNKNLSNGQNIYVFIFL